MPLLYLPEMIHLPIQLYYGFHLLLLCGLPRCFRYSRGRGQEEHTALHLIDMRMPELALLGIEFLVQVWLDQVLDSDQSSVGLVAVVDNALPDIFVQVGAVVVRFDWLAWVGGVGVEGVEMGTELFWWVEVLDHGCAGV